MARRVYYSQALRPGRRDFSWAIVVEDGKTWVGLMKMGVFQYRKMVPIDV